MSHFTSEIVAAAQKAQQDWKVPASVSLAQWALESGYGKHMPPGSNNPFGIKASGDQPYVESLTREVLHGKSVRIPQKFRKFSSLAEAFDEHARLLATKAVYASAMEAWDKPPYDLSRGVSLMALHYATDPHYAATILSIIHGQNLQQYDH